ncbi:MAG: SDR family oxidoreductase [Rhodobacteraceae bacterium]|nr:SDR family oxidoreductase [Paracoccaceae bacterium]
MTTGCLIITGGSRGIGAATARLAARRGYSICLNYLRDEAAAHTIVAGIEEAGGTAIAVPGDVGNANDVAKLFDTAEAQLGPLEGLVNNAGITGRIGRFADASEAAFEAVMRTNVLGSLYCAQEAIRRLVPRRRGVIVNLSSVAATTGAPNEYIHYAASKAAIDAFTIGLAREVAADGIRVNAVAPGSTLTDIHASAGEPNRPARVKDRIPMRRLANPDEIAQAILWLLSDEASYVTGAVLRAAGGF